MDVKSYLDRVGISQKELANNLGVSQPTISSWSKGKRPSFEIVDKMIKIGFTLNEIFGAETAGIYEGLRTGTHDLAVESGNIVISFNGTFGNKSATKRNEELFLLKKQLKALQKRVNNLV